MTSLPCRRRAQNCELDHEPCGRHSHDHLKECRVCRDLEEEALKDARIAWRVRSGCAELELPVDTVKKCEKCGQRLGSQDPGRVCGSCLFVRRLSRGCTP